MEVGSSSLPGTTSDSLGGLAQLARAPALQAGGQRFESVILHCLKEKGTVYSLFTFTFISFFDILTHKTVSKDFKLKTELYIIINSQFTAESMSNQAVCADAIFYNL